MYKIWQVRILLTFRNTSITELSQDDLSKNSWFRGVLWQCWLMHNWIFSDPWRRRLSNTLQCPKYNKKGAHQIFISRSILHKDNMCYYLLPLPWGERGRALLWFPVTQMCVSVHLSVSICARLCLHDISYKFLSVAFKLSGMVTMDTLNWLTFRDLGLIFEVMGVIMFQISLLSKMASWQTFLLFCNTKKP